MLQEESVLLLHLLTVVALAAVVRVCCFGVRVQRCTKGGLYGYVSLCATQTGSQTGFCVAFEVLKQVPRGAAALLL